MPLWAGDPVMLGSHTVADFGLVADHRDEADSPVVGQVTHAAVVGDQLRLYPTFNGRLTPAMERRGLRDLSGLTGVSLEAIVRGSADDSVFSFTNGFVLLTDEQGACSVSDGCRLVACEGDDCGCGGGCGCPTKDQDNQPTGGLQMAKTESGASEAPITMEQVHAAIKSVLAAAVAEKAEKAAPPAEDALGDSVTISRSDRSKSCGLWPVLSRSARTSSAKT